MYRGRRVAVVIPAFQEERLIGRTVASIPAWVDHVVVVDDASTDQTWEFIRSCPDARVEAVRHEKNQGVGRAIATGYEHALKMNAEMMAVMAGDGQMDPADLPSLLDPIADDRADYVKGNRFRHEDRRRMPLPRRLAGKTLAGATRMATGLDIDDSQCGYTALSARAARKLPLAELWPRYGYPNDLLGMLASHRLRVAEVTVRPVYGDEQSGVRPWHFGVVLWVILRRRALVRRSAATAQRTAVPLAR